MLSFQYIIKGLFRGKSYNQGLIRKNWVKVLKIVSKITKCNTPNNGQKWPFMVLPVITCFYVKLRNFLI